MFSEALVVVVLSYLIYNNRKFLQTLCKQVVLNIPSARSLPIIGHFHKFYRLSPEEAFVATNEFSSNFPEISKLWQFHHVCIFVSSPVLIEKVLTSKSCLQRPLLLLKFFDINEGLLSSRFEKWIHDRRFFNQFFNPNAITSYTSSLSKCVDLMIQEISGSYTNSKVFDLLPHLEKCALQGVCATLFGMDLMDKKIDVICERTAEIFNLNAKTFEAALRNPLKFLETFHKMTSNYKKVKNAQRCLTDILTTMKFGNENSLLETMMKAEGESFTRKQICEHILTFLNAGLDTTTAHLHFTILFLAMHQKTQEKLATEVNNFLKSNQVIDYDSLAKLEYLDCVMKESFRVAPPIFLIGRETTEDFEISPGIVIPKETSIAINTFVLHRRKDIYGEKSHTFNPDNFAPEKVAERHSFSFQPFSTGRRNCLGYRFAIFFIKLVLVKLVGNYEFATKSKYENLRFKYGMTLKLTEDHHVLLKKRND